ncbi:MAG: hypothetical protein ACI8X5_003781 [Planctomycetota bacterium]|jgi:hypothetical protein
MRLLIIALVVALAVHFGQSLFIEDGTKPNSAISGAAAAAVVVVMVARGKGT